MRGSEWPTIDFERRWSDAETLAAAYLRDHEWRERHRPSALESTSGDVEDGPDAWASDEVLERTLLSPDADRDWPLIVALSRACETHYQRWYVAAGPLEDYVVKHGESVIQRVEHRAATDARFRFVLGGVWQAGMSPALYLRVLRASGATVDGPEYMAYQRRRRLRLPLDIARFVGWLVAEATKASLRAMMRRLRGTTDGADGSPPGVRPNLREDIVTGPAVVEVSQAGVALATGVYPVGNATMSDGSVEAWAILDAGWRLCVTSYGSAETTSLWLESADGPVAVATPDDGLEVRVAPLAQTPFRCGLVAAALRPFAPDLDSRTYSARVHIGQDQATGGSA